MPFDGSEHRTDELLTQVMRLEPKLPQLGVRGVVVVLLLLDARVLDVLELDLVAELGSGALRELRQLEDRELLGELVEHAELGALRGIADRELDALQRVADVEEP